MSSDTPLDDAWKAAEAALPEGWVLDGLYHLFDHVGNEPSGWTVRLVGPRGWPGVGGHVRGFANDPRRSPTGPR